MPHDLLQLRPYKSFILTRIRDGAPVAPSVSAVLDDVAELLHLDSAGSRELVEREDAGRAGELSVGFLHYLESRRATWTRDETVLDHLNQLILVCRRKRHVAIYVSDPRWRLPITKELDQAGMHGLGSLQPIPPGLLNAAFVQGMTRTLWLSGTHRRTSVKADSKILSGINLRDALHPLDDQTYYFTAARSIPTSTSLAIPVGVSPRRSQIWAGTTREWPEFGDTVTRLLKHLEATSRPEDRPLPIVAIPSVDVSRIEKAFDVGLLPAELLLDDPTVDSPAHQEIELWGYNSTFQVVGTSGPNLKTIVSLGGTRLGTVEFTLDLKVPDRVTWTVKGEPESNEVEERHRDALRVCAQRDWVRIWFESGHTVSGGAVYEVRHRDVPFTDFVWANFTGFDIGREKPDPLGAIGKQDSLFCWTKNHWPIVGAPKRRRGWLACDDGAMEIADFIHLDDTSNPPVGSLIHVKGAGSCAPKRGISVSAYEVVTAQAVKNLRYLDRLHLEYGLNAGLRKRIGSLVWHDGVATTRKGMLAALSAIKTNYKRRVVVLQPHLKKAKCDHARAHPSSGDAARLRQLDTLLHGAEASCHGLGAQMVLVAEK